MSKSILVVETPNSCKECSLVMGKSCPVIGVKDLSPCKVMNIKHRDCPLRPAPVADEVLEAWFFEGQEGVVKLFLGEDYEAN